MRTCAAKMPVRAATGQVRDSLRVSRAMLDLDATLRSGQAFGWVASPEGGWRGTIGREAVEAVPLPCGGGWKLRGAAPATLRRYFGLDLDLSRVVATFPGDTFMQESLRYAPGLRILCQPPWECLASFITSALKQVAQIQRVSHAMRERYGEPVDAPWGKACCFPAAVALAAAGEEGLRACGMGFRARPLARTARIIASGEIRLEDLAQLSDAELEAALLTLPGVGPKIAACVMLFAYGRHGAFPIDVWMERVLRERYAPEMATQRELRDFARSYFGPCAGYAQQYLFHYARTAGAGRSAPS